MHLFLLRHAPTSWNLEKRIQGRTDIPLSDEAQSALSKLTLPPEWLQLKWVSSPLQRARSTASLLGVKNYDTHPALLEMDWGQFEGMQLPEINRQIKALGLNPARGLDMQPPDGESPRVVRNRFAKWLGDQVHSESDMIAVTHKGVIRAALSLATGWDMQRPFDEEIDWRLPLAFDLSKARKFKLIRVNCAWEDTAILE